MNPSNFSSKIVSPSQVIELCSLAKEYENQSEYDLALEALSVCWQGLEHKPVIKGLPDAVATELLLRCGSLVGYCGIERQQKDLQEHSKALLTDAFYLCADEEQKADIQNTMGLCYFREGAFDEAMTWFDSALEHVEPTAQQGITAQIYKTMVYRSSGRYEDSESLCKSIFAGVLTLNDKPLLARFYNGYGITLRRLGKLEEAYTTLKKAHAIGVNIGNFKFAMACVNNIAQTLILMKRYSEANVEYENAKIYLLEKGHKQWYADILENQAEMYLELGNLDRAEECANEAIKIFQAGDEYAKLFEALSTRSLIYLRAERNAEALFDIARAALIAEERISESTARKYLEQLASQIYFRSSLSFQKERHNFEAMLIREALIRENGSVVHAARHLGLSSHQALSDMLTRRHKALRQYQKSPQPSKEILAKDFPVTDEKPFPLIHDVQIISAVKEADYLPKIRAEHIQFVFPENFPYCHLSITLDSNHLSHLGIPRGSILLITDRFVKDGDVIAIRKIGEEEVFIGSMMKSAGIVGLDIGPEFEPLVFSEEEIEILGCVAGFSDYERSLEDSGAFIVKTLEKP